MTGTIVSPYRAAINLTTETIDGRARNFRNLIVAVVVVTFCSLGGAALSRTSWPAAGLLLLMPLCGIFFIFDSRLLNRWRSDLVASWVRKDIDFRAFCDTVKAVPELPQDTLTSMLATLPTGLDVVAESQVSTNTREGVAARMAIVHALQTDTIALKTVGAAILAVVGIIAVASRRWQPLTGSLTVLLFPILKRFLKRRRIVAMQKGLLTARGRNDFSDEKYAEMLAFLQDEPDFARSGIGRG